MSIETIGIFFVLILWKNKLLKRLNEYDELLDTDWGHCFV